MSGVKDRPGYEGHSARDYGRAAEPLPELHVFSRLSELDEAYAEELAHARARQETIERDVSELAKRLMAPLEGAIAPQDAPRERRWFGRSSTSSSHTRRA
ncbi:MAG TPA: hypothetical protein VGN05_14705 [Parvibaculum sp.]